MATSRTQKTAKKLTNEHVFSLSSIRFVKLQGLIFSRGQLECCMILEKIVKWPFILKDLFSVAKENKNTISLSITNEKLPYSYGNFILLWLCTHAQPVKTDLPSQLIFLFLTCSQGT